MNIKQCPPCDSDQIKARKAGTTVAFKGSDVSVPGLQHTVCGACDHVFTLPHQFDANVASARAAHVKQHSAAKANKSLLTGTQLRAVREEVQSHTQPQAPFVIIKYKIGSGTMVAMAPAVCQIFESFKYSAVMALSRFRILR